MYAKKNVIVVSGLPRSGTSMMMHILQAGGINLLIDDKRPADHNNPNGYFEFEKVKSLEKDNSWIADCQGKAIKILFHLLNFLPKDLHYKVIFMQRDLNAILASQDKMLKSYSKPIQQDNDRIKFIFEKELAEVTRWLKDQGNMEVLYVSYKKVLTETNEITKTIQSFLNRKLDLQKMSSVVNSALSSTI